MSDNDKKSTESPAPENSVAEGVENAAAVDQNSHSELKNIIEAAIFAANEPIGVRKLLALFIDGAQPTKEEVEVIIADLDQDYQNKGLELVRIGSGWRFQSREKYSSWLRKLSADKAPRYSRAQLETLSIIAYRQPVTRGDIEEVRGVSVSSDIIRILEERGWIREIGHRDVPGRPALFGTTQEFLAYFNLRSLKELPELIEQRKFQEIAQEMHMNLPLDLEQPVEKSDTDDLGADGKKSADIIPLRQEFDEIAEETDDEINPEASVVELTGDVDIADDVDITTLTDADVATDLATTDPAADDAVDQTIIDINSTNTEENDSSD